MFRRQYMTRASGFISHSPSPFVACTGYILGGSSSFPTGSCFPMRDDNAVSKNPIQPCGDGRVKPSARDLAWRLRWWMQA